MSKWISVEERLPEKMDCCLIYYCEYWNYDKTYKMAWAFFNSDNEFCIENSKVKPTHWMPLPRTPNK